MITVRYTSTRADIWRWYWIAWLRPSGLWRYHVGISLLAAAVDALRLRPAAVPWERPATVFGLALLVCVAVLPWWPQLRFKPTARTLTITPKGIDTSIGRRCGSIAWKAVQSVEQAGGTIVITGTNKNAFIVPARAFASDEVRAAFYQAAERYRSDAART